MASNGMAELRQNSLTIVLTNPPLATANYESHSWTFPLTKSSFSFNQATSTASLSTGAQMNPFGSAKLSFKKTSSKKASCKTGSRITDYGNLTGTLYFNTNSGAWGALGSRSQEFRLLLSDLGDIR